MDGLRHLGAKTAGTGTRRGREFTCVQPLHRQVLLRSGGQSGFTQQPVQFSLHRLHAM